MSFPAARIFDVCTGHDGYRSRPATQGSPDTFINARAAHRQGDAWSTHCNVSCHSGVLATGSTKCFVNGRPLGRVNDAVNCGSRVATGSNDVFVD
jgi:uncharacterized Zn-binding protein involved in type VI secretion